MTCLVVALNRDEKRCEWRPAETPPQHTGSMTQIQVQNRPRQRDSKMLPNILMRADARQTRTRPEMR